MSEGTCTHHEIFGKSHSLHYLCYDVALNACAEKQDLFNFFELYWCDMDGKLWLMILCALFVIFVIFKYTSITVEEYIAEGIQNISDWLGLSDSLAAVTLLAFANGAGDVITAIVASDADGGVSYNIGSLYGAGLFVCSMVVGVCILQNDGDLIFDSMIVYRDIGFYIGAIVITICLGLYKEITWWGSLILLGWYVVMVLVVVFVDKNNTDEIGGQYQLEGDRISKPAMIEKVDELHYSKQKMDHSKRSHVEDEDDNMLHPPKSDVGYSDVSSGDRKEVAAIFAPLMMEIGANQGSAIDNFYGGFNSVKVNHLSNQLLVKLQYIKMKRKLKEQQKNCSELFMHFVETPFIYALKLTVLPCDKDQYSKKRCLLYPVPGMLFFVWVFTRELNRHNLIIALSAAIILELIFLTTLGRKPPKYFILIVLMGVIGALMWTYLLVGVLVDLLTAIGVILNLDNTYLGLTILAIGNALPDALTTIALCKKGAGTLALSGGYAGQLFGLLIGFGISMLKLTLTEGPQPFDIFEPKEFKQNSLILLVIGTAFFVLMLTFIYAVLNKFIMKNSLGIMLIFIYGAFICFTTYIAISRAIG